MNLHRLSIGSWIILASLIFAGSLYAQKPAKYKDFQPRSGQSGKDVIWVPTPQALVDKMLEMAKIEPTDYVIDLGSGDGRLVISAAKRGTPALGVEFNPDMVELSIQNAEKEGLSKKAKFIQGDLFEMDLSKATVITLFLLPELNLRLRPKLLELKPGTRIVSNAYTMEEWEADETVRLDDDCSIWCRAHLWIVPAKVNGKWALDQGELIFQQKFQTISGTLKTGNNSINISDGRLKGNEIAFTANGAKYSGTVERNRIRGEMVVNGKSSKWGASR